MKFLFLIPILLSSFWLQAQNLDYTKVPQIQTRATYTTEVQPDKITLSITLAESNTKGKVSTEDLEQILESVLKTNNIDIKKQLFLKDLSSNFQNYFLKKTEVQKTKNYNLEIYDAKTAGKIMRELADNGISNVKLVAAEYSKLEELKIELKGKAVVKAKKQAEEMATAMQQKVGPVIFISDMETNVMNLLRESTSLKVRGINSLGYNNLEEDNLDVGFNKIRVEATVSVYFKLD